MDEPKTPAAPSLVTTSESYDVPVDTQKLALNALRCSFCRRCGSPMNLVVPPTETSLRHVCTAPECGYVDYHNPKMVVGCLVEHEGKVLLCRRALEPCKGLWTLPAGYMELAESTQEGAVRETWEEAQARVEVVSPYMHLDIPVIGQAYIIFRARLLEPFTFAAGDETLELGLYDAADIPFDELAFSSMEITLRHWVEDQKRGEFVARVGTIVKKPGASMRDKSSFDYVENFTMRTAPAEARL